MKNGCRVSRPFPSVLGEVGREAARIQRGRAVLLSVARRHSGASLRETVSYLGARDPSMVSHGVRRAESRLKEERTFRQQVERVVSELVHSRIQA